MNRSIFARQPAHILLVDFSPPFDIDICHNLHQSLENLFSLVCNLGGPCRTPIFGLFALGSYPECLFPLQHVRGNYPKVYSAIIELKNYLSDGTLSAKNCSCVTQGLQEALGQFKRQANTFRQMTGFSNQLEVTIITAHQATVICQQVEKMTSNIDLENVKKIQIVSVTNPDKLVFAEDDFESTCSQGSKSSSTNTTCSTDNAVLLTCGIVDVLDIENDELSLQNFFKSWLHDCGTDREHLHILLPPAKNTTTDAGQQKQNIILKCDLHERLLNPSQLPFQAQYCLQTDAVNAKPILASTVNKGNSPLVTINRLKASKLIKADSVCESVLYGVPLMVRPTACWKLDWEELDTNQQNFQAFCHLLQEKEFFLLAVLDIEDASINKHNPFNYQAEPPKPCGYFLLMPSQSTTLLIKSIAVNELMLPCDFQIPTERPVSDTMEMLSDSLGQLEVEESFNPLLVKSFLYRSLSSSLLKNSTPRQQKRKNFSNHSLNSKTQNTYHSTRGRGQGRGSIRSQYPPVTCQPKCRPVAQVPSQQKRYCPPPPPTAQDVYTFEDFPNEL
ncbi:meiosis 1 arrest protein-like [Saccoglossus kowalevskii]|uniref:Meiosis 1 arrest protein-like n=1 Tax=Saccoglossus kowalevskii TaxID=10224 RepID=A0ABM0LVG6_SACKO|nr:PREDICTED: meiosis 1 arrest protein-like [Saccoglossus kowalevskii]